MKAAIITYFYFGFFLKLLTITVTIIKCNSIQPIKTTTTIFLSFKNKIFTKFGINLDNDKKSVVMVSNNNDSHINNSSTKRPLMVLDKISKGEDIYYFGVGSNMLRSKVENRGAMFINTTTTELKSNKTSIELKSFIPAIARDYRLAFNMRGFPPIEPAMGGIELSVGSECHGALMHMSPIDYNRLYLSEGGGQPNPGYTEIIVDCYPYGQSTPIKAVALQTSDHVKLKKDANPSKRYMNILIEGATELKLTDYYINYLKNEIITANPSIIITWLSRQHIHFTSFLFRNKMRQIQRFISSLLWLVYVPYNNNIVKIIISEIFIGIILLPGATIGLMIRFVYHLIGKKSTTFFDSINKKK